MTQDEASGKYTENAAINQAEENLMDLINKCKKLFDKNPILILKKTSNRRQLYQIDRGHLQNTLVNIVLNSESLDNFPQRSKKKKSKHISPLLFNIVVDDPASAKKKKNVKCI